MSGMSSRPSGLASRAIHAMYESIGKGLSRTVSDQSERGPE